MRLRLAGSAAPLCLLLAVLAGAPARAQDDHAFARGRTLMRWLLAGQADSLRTAMAPDFMAAVGGPEGLTRLVGQMATQLGAEEGVLDEVAFREGGHTTYYRVSRFANLPGASVTARWAWDAAGVVVGANASPTPPPAPTEHLAYETRTPLRLPFGAPARGTWYVAWGGRDAIHNYHVVAPDQRFAYDLLVADGDTVHTGDGTRNEDYLCWDEPVLAPAAGRVVVAVDFVADNAPGTLNGDYPPGNHVVIDHGNGEHSLLAHFRRGTVAVHADMTVEAGQLLGRCGNSGRSSMPHVHYHLQTGAAYAQGVGLPAFFHGYLSGGRLVERGEPTRGEWLTPSPAD